MYRHSDKPTRLHNVLRRVGGKKLNICSVNYQLIFQQYSETRESTPNLSEVELAELWWVIDVSSSGYLSGIR